MSLRITIDIFSGRPNPVFEVSGNRAREILERVRPTRRLSKGEMPSPDFRLGYRGLVIERKGAGGRDLPPMFRLAAGAVYGRGLSHLVADPDVEEFIAGSRILGPRLKGVRRLPGILKTEMARLKHFQEDFRLPYFPWPPKPVCRCAPLYEPAWWNDGGQKQWNNNCYNYATNYRTDTFAQPGRAAGAMYTSLTCGSVRPAAIADALIHTPGANNKCPKEGHLVALVIWPGVDFHWYRKGRNGRWSHKPGGTQVTNLDNSGDVITDPRTADRGNYTVFCTFMTVMHGHIKIN
jgi:hypothetical protein